MYASILLLALLIQRCATGFSRNCLFTDDIVKCMSRNTEDKRMNRVLLSGDNAPTCNDETPAGYYYRTNPKSSIWIIYLEGGWFCSDPQECFKRTIENGFSTVTSSKSWKSKRSSDGLLSIDPSENAEFWQANHVFVPYCSSDFWIGDTIARGVGDTKIAFHGSRIVTEVVKDLLNRGLKHADHLIMTGSSAGGIGVLQNIDRVSSLISSYVDKKIDVRGLVDSAWVLDVPPVKGCDDCNPNLVFKTAVKYWNAVPHSKCSQAHKGEEQQCLFASNVLKYIKRPIFVFQWLMDTVQILTENTHSLNLEGDYLKDLGLRVKATLRKSINGRKRDGIFAVSCVSHTGLATTSSLNSIQLKGFTLNHALTCWLGTNKLTNCRKRLVDSCTGIDCHQNCPIISHPITGTEVSRPSLQKQNITSVIDGMDDRARFYLELFKGIQQYKLDRNRQLR